jgi:outer membrane protein OmpA-like peptidoglycan-associated protein
MVQVVGYTSATGSGGHNQALGVRRAAVITDFIRQDAANNGW